MSDERKQESVTPRILPQLSIAPATFEDVEALLTLVRACIRQMRSEGIEQWDDEYPDRATIETDVRSRTLFVALYRGATVGTFVLNDVQEAEYGSVPWQFTSPPTAVVHRLMVLPTMEHQGFAQALMKFAEARAVLLGYRTIRLDAFAENPRALRLYQRLGYHDAGQVLFRKGHFRCFEKELPAGEAAGGVRHG